MVELTSAKNPLLQSIRRAAAAGRTTDEGLIVIEGPHLLEEAIGGEWRVEQIFATGEGRQRYAELLHRADCEIVEVSARAFAVTASTEAPQHVLALLRPRQWTWPDLLRRTAPVVVLDGIQDPGNGGTMVRSAEAFGASGLVFLKGCVRVANGKFLRATAGSIFRVPFVESLDETGFLRQVRSNRLSLYALTTSGGISLEEADLRGASALLVGSEGAGVSPAILSEAQAVSIPTATVESLNAAIACSIALYAAQQQRNAS